MGGCGQLPTCLSFLAWLAVLQDFQLGPQFPKKAGIFPSVSQRAPYEPDTENKADRSRSYLRQAHVNVYVHLAFVNAGRCCRPRSMMIALNGLRRPYVPRPRPLKRVYPWGQFPKEKRMTIAAGLLHQNGVLLCADTLERFNLSTTHGLKIHRLDREGGRVLFALAGHTANAISAIQKCKRKLEKSSPGEWLRLIEATVDEEYRRLVFSHPDRLSCQDDLDYSLLVAVQRDGAPVQLFRTHEVLMNQIEPVDGFACIGIGEGLADYLLRSSFTVSSERQCLRLAAYTFAIVKKHVPDCGGDTVCLSLRSDGTIGEFYGDREIEQIERAAGGYFLKAQQLFFAHLDDYQDETDFGRNVGGFNDYVFQLRNEWREILERYRPRPVGQSLPQSTTHDP